MITIKNTQMIIGSCCLNRRIWNVTKEENKLGEKFYCFHFGHDGDGKNWNKPIEVRLNRECREDRHYLFVMGLEMVTGTYITQQSIRDKEELISKIAYVMSKAKHWWERQ